MTINEFFGGLLFFVFFVGVVFFVLALLDENSWFWEYADPDPPGCDRLNDD